MGNYLWVFIFLATFILIKVVFDVVKKFIGFKKMTPDELKIAKEKHSNKYGWEFFVVNFLKLLFHI